MLRIKLLSSVCSWVFLSSFGYFNYYKFLNPAPLGNLYLDPIEPLCRFVDSVWSFFNVAPWDLIDWSLRFLESSEVCKKIIFGFTRIFYYFWRLMNVESMKRLAKSSRDSPLQQPMISAHTTKPKHPIYVAQINRSV